MAEKKVNLLYSYIMTSDTGFAPNPFGGICTLACCKPGIRRSVHDAIITAAISEFKKENNFARLTEKKKSEAGISFTLSEIKEKDPDFIRRQGIWITGFAGGNLRAQNVPATELIYAMHVTDIVTHEEYSRMKEYSYKRPIGFPVNAGQAYKYENCNSQYCGDNIYTFLDHSVEQQPSFHQTDGILNVETLAHDLSGLYVLISDDYIYLGRKKKVVPLNEELLDGMKIKPNGRQYATFSITSESERKVCEAWENLLETEWANLFYEKEFIPIESSPNFGCSNEKGENRR